MQRETSKFAILMTFPHFARCSTTRNTRCSSPKFRC